MACVRIERPYRSAMMVLAAGSTIVAALVALWSWQGRRGPIPGWRTIEEAAEAQRWGDVEEALRLRLKADPDDGLARARLGGLLFDQGRDAEALETLRPLPANDPEWPHARTIVAEIAIRRRDVDEAERILREVCRRDRRAVEPLRRLVYLLNLERRTAEARAILLRLYELTGDPLVLADAMIMRRENYDVRESGPELEANWERQPEHPWLRRAWGLALLEQGLPGKALPLLEAAAVDFTDDLPGRFALVECRMASGTFDDDLGLLGVLPDRPPDAARWWVYRGRLEEAMGRPGDAEESFRRALAVDPDRREAHFRLGQILLLGDESGEAATHLGRAAALRERETRLDHFLARILAHGPDADSLQQLGRLCLEAGFFAEARAWFEQADRLDPGRRHLGPELGRLPRSADGWAEGPSDPRLLPSSDPSSPGPASGTTPPGNAGEAADADAPIAFQLLPPRESIDFSYDHGGGDDLFIADTMGGGVGLIDFDNDNRLDVYFVNGCALPFDPRDPPRPNRLYRNLGGGAFEDVTERACVSGEGYGMGCAVGDYDHDGLDDLFVTGLNRTILYRNRADGTFEDVTSRAGVESTRWTTAAGFGDLDRDGDLDLVAVTYVSADPGDSHDCRDDFSKPIHCPPHQFPAQLDHLFRNNGDGTFTDVGAEAGFEVPEGRGLGLAIADLDGDDQLDLFVANDGVANFLFHNLGGLRFEEVAQIAGVSHDGSGLATASMGVVADDLNGDGLIDLFHTNLINQGSTLRWNLGGLMFVDGTMGANLAAPSRSRTGFGAAALDFDNDGRLDLFVANGHVDEQPWFNNPMAQLPQMFVAVGSGRFAAAGTEVSSYLARPVVGRGVAAGDLDNDGRVDLVVVHREAPVAVLLNRSRAGHWLGLRLRGTDSGSTPVGARVTCRVAGADMIRRLISGTGYLSSHDTRLFFGLGTARLVDRLEVRWPSGTSQEWFNVHADQFLELVEGDPTPRVMGSEPSHAGSAVR